MMTHATCAKTLIAGTRIPRRVVTNRENDMTTFNIGDRVRFVRADKPERTLVGTVRKVYLAWELIPERAEGVPDVIPEWWPYPDCDSFAPDTDELTIINKRI